MSFLDDSPLLAQDEPVEPVEARVIDITKELRKARTDLDADSADKSIKIGRYEFGLTESVSAVAMSNLSEATAGETTRVDLLIAGIARLIKREDRDAFMDFLEDEEISASQLGAMTEEIVKVISGKA